MGEIVGERRTGREASRGAIPGHETVEMTGEQRYLFNLLAGVQTHNRSLSDRHLQSPPLQRSHGATEKHAPSPDCSTVFEAKGSRRRAQGGFRPEGRGGVRDSTSSTPRRENTAACGESSSAVETS
jgi:hypothetical protein